jgi:hypothetical protein
MCVYINCCKLGKLGLLQYVLRSLLRILLEQFIHVTCINALHVLHILYGYTFIPRVKVDS